jgi:hypothetical protein
VITTTQHLWGNHVPITGRSHVTAKPRRITKQVVSALRITSHLWGFHWHATGCFLPLPRISRLLNDGGVCENIRDSCEYISHSWRGRPPPMWANRLIIIIIIISSSSNH